MAKRLTVEFVINEGMGADFESIVLPVTQRVRDEDPGCIHYHLYQCLDEDDRYVLIEAWENADTLDAHGKSPATEGFAKLTGLLAEKPVLHRYED